MKHLTWVEVSGAALRSNMKEARKQIGNERVLCACVKGNAYGHDLVLAAKEFLAGGADWLGVISLEEAVALRRAGVLEPILVMGYIALENLDKVAEYDLRPVIFNLETVQKLNDEAEKQGKKVAIHVKIETGNNRQGVLLGDLPLFIKQIKRLSSIEIEGACSHFANIEDTTNQSYALEQLKNFNRGVEIFQAEGVNLKIRHIANSAATILMPETYFEMVRTGIFSYGLWPSNETLVSAMMKKNHQQKATPALTWKTVVGQVKTIAAGEYVGYGCTYRTSHETKLAILPIGYYDGYDRGLSGSGAYVLIRGKRAPLRGRVCMNIIMVEVTDIEGITLEDEVVLIGKQGDEVISVEQFAAWAGTINYEAVTRINDRIPRILI